MKNEKPLGIKSYGSIPHLPNSRAGQRDFQADSGMVRIATEKTRDKNDLVIVTEKVDGSNCSVAKISGELVALGRAGYRAETSPYEQHKMFAEWVKSESHRFDALLNDGERIVGEWMAQAHGTIYRLPHEPFIVFDLMRGHERATSEEFESRVLEQGFILPHRLHTGDAISVQEILNRLEPSGHGAVGLAEGAVWRVERAFPTGTKGGKKLKVDFLVKYVRLEKIDGCLLPEKTLLDPIWNWKP